MLELKLKSSLLICPPVIVIVMPDADGNNHLPLWNLVFSAEINDATILFDLA